MAKKRKRGKIPPAEGGSWLKGKSEKRDELESVIVFSFKDFDPDQGQTFGQWEEQKLLAPTLERFKHYSKHTFETAQSSKFKTYKEFPSKSHFRHPKHVIEDADWTSMHLQGKECIIGHRFRNIFYVVFLDCEHKFSPSTKKHT